MFKNSKNPMPMMLLVTRVVLTIIVLSICYFGLVKIWTENVDIIGLLKRPSDAIPVLEKENRNEVEMPHLAVRVRFPYNQIDDSVRVNRRNPILEVTNTGLDVMAPIKVNVTIFSIQTDFSKVVYGAFLADKSHGRFIFEPELKPGLSVSSELPGILNWTNPAIYRIQIESSRFGTKLVPGTSVLCLIDDKEVKLGNSALPESDIEKINRAITAFEENKELFKKVNLEGVTDGAWLATPGKNTKLKKNEDGTLSIE